MKGPISECVTQLAFSSGKPEERTVFSEVPVETKNVTRPAVVIRGWVGGDCQVLQEAERLCNVASPPHLQGDLLLREPVQSFALEERRRGQITQVLSSHAAYCPL